MSTTMKSSGEHRRGRSMGSYAARAGEKDEDLALFHEMKRREKHNFLHPSPDDLDATLSSKFGGMGAPVKKIGNELLASESDKNDYDWLLTPPGTPLFPSLDQEAAALVVQLSPALSNGSYSSASSATKSMKSSHSPAESLSKGSRGNPSPRRSGSAGSTPNGISRSRSSPTSAAATLSRPSTPTSTTGTRPSTPTAKSTSTSSVRASTPNLKLTISNSSKNFSSGTTPTGGARPSTPTARSSTPPVRPSTPGGRSSTPTSKPSTPTMRRSLSGGRTGLTSPSTTRGGPSPKRTTSSSRGNSPSAKRVTAVITSVAGMSCEVPPNLRTSVPERPTSSGNGSRTMGSESGHNGDESQNRRRPRSPSVARSFSSSSSQDQRTSSQTSRGSVISSYDDGLEVNRPSLGSNRNSSAGKWHAAAQEELLSAKTSAFVKRVARSSVAPKETSGGGYGGTPTKKSSDQMKRPVDAYQNSPTSAYRHLHSSSPGSPFYSTRSNSMLLRPGSTMNSSVTTSSNASSEHGTTVAPDTEGSERDEDDLLSWDSYGRRASTSPRVQADILVLDKDDDKIGSWPDSIYERPNSHDPASQTPESQSTVDTEVASFYETDGIASLEMLEQLGVMGGETYKLKKSSTFGGMSSVRRVGSAEDSKIPIPRLDSGHLKNAHRLFHEAQSLPGSHGSKIQRQESLESLRKSRNFEMELLKKNGDIALGLPEPKPPNSEIRAACLFVRDFKVGPASSNTQEESAFVDNSSPGLSLLGIGEIERKLRNDLSHDWDNSLDLVDQDAIMDVAANKIDSKLSDSPILVARSDGDVASLVPLSLEDPFISGATVYDMENNSIGMTCTTGPTVYDMQNNSIDMTCTAAKHVGFIELTDPEPTLAEVDLKRPVSLNNAPTSVANDGSYVLDGGLDEQMMDESETECKDEDSHSSIAPKDVQFAAMTNGLFTPKTVGQEESMVFSSQMTGFHSGASEDELSAMDADAPAKNFAENTTLFVHSSEGEEEPPLMGLQGEQFHEQEVKDTQMDLDMSCSSSAENIEEDSHECVYVRKPSEREALLRALKAASFAEGSMEEFADEDFEKEFLMGESQKQIADAGFDVEQHFTGREKMEEVTEVGYQTLHFLDGENDNDVGLQEEQVSDEEHLQEFCDAGLEATPFLEVVNQDEDERWLMTKLSHREDDQEVTTAEPEFQFQDRGNELEFPDDRIEGMHFSEPETWADLADDGEEGMQIPEGDSQQEVTHARLDVMQFLDSKDQPDVAQISEGETRQEVPHGALKVVQLSGRQDLKSDVPFGGLEVLKLFNKEDQQEGAGRVIADARQDIVHFSEGKNEKENAAEAHYDTPYFGEGLHILERGTKLVQNVHSNENYKAGSEYAGILKTGVALAPHHLVETPVRLAGEGQSQELLVHSMERYELDPREMPVFKTGRESPLHPSVVTVGASDTARHGLDVRERHQISPVFDDTREGGLESPLHPSLLTVGASDTETISSTAPMSCAVWEEIQVGEVKPQEIAVDEFEHSFHSPGNQQKQEESRSLDYFDTDSVGLDDNTDEEVSSVSCQVQEDSECLNFCNSDLAKEFDYLEEVPEDDWNVVQTTPSSLFSEVLEEPTNEDSNLFQNSYPEHPSPSFENVQMLEAVVDGIELAHETQKHEPLDHFVDLDTEVVSADSQVEYLSDALGKNAFVPKLDNFVAPVLGKLMGMLDEIQKEEDSFTTVLQGKHTEASDMPKSADSGPHIVGQKTGGLDLVLKSEGSEPGQQMGVDLPPSPEIAIAHDLRNQREVSDLASQLENPSANGLEKQTGLLESPKLDSPVVHDLRQQMGVLVDPNVEDSVVHGIGQQIGQLEDPKMKDHVDNLGKEAGLVDVASKLEDSASLIFGKETAVSDMDPTTKDSGAHLDIKKAELLDLVLRSEDSSASVPEKHEDAHELVTKLEHSSGFPPPKIEFRSASTLCAALEMQIAGLIQKIDSAIEESSKPFNSCQQDGVLPKDEHSTFSSAELARELEQDECTASIRSSHEEDLLDMLWAEDDGGASFSEGSRDQDLSNSKDGSQREMNNGRSSRLSDRVLAISPLDQPGEAYEAVVRSSLSDLGVEKYQVIDQFKKSSAGLLNDCDDSIQSEMNGVISGRFSDGGRPVSPIPKPNEVVVISLPSDLGAVKHQMESLKKSALGLASQPDDDGQICTGSPEENLMLKKSQDRVGETSTGHTSGFEGLNFNLDAVPEIGNSSVDSIPNMEGGVQRKKEEALHIVPHEQEPNSDNMMESTGNEGDDMKIDELSCVSLSLGKGDVSDVSGDLGSRQDKDTGVGDRLVKKLPINKAKSVRTVSLSAVAQNDLSTEVCESPNGQVQVDKSNGHTDATVILPESVQWDQSLLVDEVGIKTKTSPGTLSRNLTLAEAADTILYCSSLMHTIVYKAAAYAIEKEELAALASTPTSNGETLVYQGFPETDQKDQTEFGEGEKGQLKGQGVTTTPTPVHQSLSYMGQQTLPSAPADTSLQIPEDQVIEKEVRSPEKMAHIAIPVYQKDELPAKPAKSKCGCTIM